MKKIVITSVGVILIAMILSTTALGVFSNTNKIPDIQTKNTVGYFESTNINWLNK